MAQTANTNRLATSRVLITAVDQLKACAGLTIQTHRAYESPSRGGNGLTQTEVANKAGGGATQGIISNLEQGKSIPADPMLSSILRESGFDMAGSGASLLAVLQAVRDHEGNLAGIEDDKPV
jgi:hypothetical protein